MRDKCATVKVPLELSVTVTRGGLMTVRVLGLRTAVFLNCES